MLSLLVAGVIAGLVLSGRATDRARDHRADAGRPRPQRSRPWNRRPRRRTFGRPRLHARRRANGSRGHQHFLGAGGAPPGIAVRERSVLPVLLRRSGRDVRPQPRRTEPWLGRRDFIRRICRHQQPRDWRRRGRSHGDGRRSSRREGQDHRRRFVDRPRPAEDRRHRPAGHSVGRFVEVEGRRMGDGGRQPVLAQPDRDARHRQRARPRQCRHHAVRGFHPDRRRDQSWQLGRRADQQPRRARSASTPRSFRRAAATRASGSPCPATWCAASSTICRSSGACGAARLATSR